MFSEHDHQEFTWSVTVSWFRGKIVKFILDKVKKKRIVCDQYKGLGYKNQVLRKSVKGG
jgi:hypothetical protein